MDEAKAILIQLRAQWIGERDLVPSRSGRLWRRYQDGIYALDEAIASIDAREPTRKYVFETPRETVVL